MKQKDLELLLAQPEILDAELKKWHRIARPKQLPPPLPWRVWFLRPGRGWGKTKTLVEWSHDMAEENPGSAGFLAGRTMPDAKQTFLHHPRSGLLMTQRPNNPITTVETRGLVRWKNGSWARFFSSEEPDSARGPEHDWGAADEVATWSAVRDFAGNTLWMNLLFGLRGGKAPRMAVATTPRRNNEIVHSLIEQAKDPANGVIMVTGSMHENAANLPESFIRDLVQRYEGTQIGRQELDGEYLEDISGALVTRAMSDDHRVARAPLLRRITVGVDPSGGADEQGIVVAGVSEQRHLYVLEDASGIFTPDGWGKRAVGRYHQWQANRLVAEKNFGGDMVQHLIRSIDQDVVIKMVTASRGKHIRFEPVAALYEQGRVHHVGSGAHFKKLEDEVTAFTRDAYEGKGSPNRADALVWAISDLVIKKGLSAHDLYGEQGLFGTVASATHT